jgi:hypothetical protein
MHFCGKSGYHVYVYIAALKAKFGRSKFADGFVGTGLMAA